MTLLRQTVNILLAFQGIITREFISMDGHFVVTVCYGHEHNLLKVYEYLQMNKFLDISIVDLMSLEPLDSKGRPLRLHKTLQKRKDWQLMYDKDHDELFDEIRAKLRSIDYQKMVREFKGMWDKDLVKEENAALQIYEHDSVPLDMWKNYLAYLRNLDAKVTKIRRDYHVNKHKSTLTFHSKFSSRTDFGLLMKRLTEKTQRDDYFHLRNMQSHLEQQLEGSTNDRPRDDRAGQGADQAGTGLLPRQGGEQRRAHAGEGECRPD